MADDTDALWSIDQSMSPIIGTAIHNGGHIRPGFVAPMALDAAGRLREEDPFTEHFIADLPNRVVVHRSRFEIDLNRARAEAVYLRPEQAWGLNLWNTAPPQDEVDRSLWVHDAYYATLRQVLSTLESAFGQFVLLDMHSYNHRRDGADAAPSPEEKAPVINIGTFSMDRQRWAHVLDPFIDSLRSFQFEGRGMDVRENVAFEGRGEQTRFVHEAFPQTGCAIAVEFKKVFMDEWTGAPDHAVIDAFRRMIAQSVPVLLGALKAGR